MEKSILPFSRLFLHLSSCFLLLYTSHMSEHKLNREERALRDVYDGEISTHLKHIEREFKEGFEFLRKYPKSVSIFGSSMTPSSDTSYMKAEEMAGRIVSELGYAVLTGGGPGIMEAATKGATEAGGQVAGLNISLPHERTTNEYLTMANSLKFSYFFSRKTMLTFAAEAYVFFPGGYGTFDELFSILTLIQTDKIPHVPLFLFGSEYWSRLEAFIREMMLERHHTIDQKDIEIFKITDSIDDVLETIKKAPVSDWWRNIN